MGYVNIFLQMYGILPGQYEKCCTAPTWLLYIYLEVVTVNLNDFEMIIRIDSYHIFVCYVTQNYF